MFLSTYGSESKQNHKQKIVSLSEFTDLIS